MHLPSFSSLRLIVPGLLAFALLPALAVSAATPTKIFVASSGNDANAGGPLDPKRTFQAAQNAVAAGGSIVALDTAGYGAVTITKSLAITVPPGVSGFVTVTGTANAITISAAATDVVTLRGLAIEGASKDNGIGIYSTSVGTLRIENCTVRNLATGINLSHQYTSETTLAVRACSISDGTNGILVGVPTGGVSASIVDCTVDLVSGIAIYIQDTYNSSSGGGRVDGISSNCTLTNCGTGVRMSGLGSWMVDRCVFSRNGYSIYNESSNYVTMVASGCTIGNDANEITGTVSSRGNNALAFPGTVTFPNTAALK